MEARNHKNIINFNIFKNCILPNKTYSFPFQIISVLYPITSVIKDVYISGILVVNLPKTSVLPQYHYYICINQDEGIGKYFIKSFSRMMTRKILRKEIYQFNIVYNIANKCLLFHELYYYSNFQVKHS